MTMCQPGRAVRAMILTICGLLAAGCGGNADRPLDQDGARQSLQTALTAWKDGKKPTDLKPGIIVGDTDWEAGTKLVDFKILTEETNDGSNLHIPAELTLKPAQGPEKKTNATYTVGTSPVITVIRE